MSLEYLTDEELQKSLTPEEAAEELGKPEINNSYLAGFFDGEGSIMIKKGSGSSYFMLAVYVANTRIEILEEFKRRYGGSLLLLSGKGNRKDIYQWSLHAKKCDKFLDEMKDYLILKRPQLLLARKFRNLFKGENRLPHGNRINDGRHDIKIRRVMQEREQCYYEIAVLNKRGRN